MAKSLRSKWRRKCRAVKRVRYGEKELARLKATLGIDDKAQSNVEMPEISEIATVTDIKAIKDNTIVEPASGDVQPEPMEDDSKRIYNKKTLLDQFGNYPVWMSNRKISKHKKGRAKTKKATFKQDARRTRKQKKNAKATKTVGSVTKTTESATKTMESAEKTVE